MKPLKEINLKNNKNNFTEQQSKVIENEYEPVSVSENPVPSKNINQYKYKRNNIFFKIFNYTFCIILFLIIIFGIYYYSNKNNDYKSKFERIYKFNISNSSTLFQINGNENKTSEKVGIAFVMDIIFGSGIGRMLSLLCSELSKIEKYDIYLITGKGSIYDFPFDEKVKIIRIAGNYTLIKEFDKKSNIKIMFYKMN